MAEKTRKKKGLGKGLDALLSGWETDEGSLADGVVQVEVDRIRPNPHQPRREFEPEALAELERSIREKGILQPILVREKDDHYELIAGERRWRAARRCGLTRIPAVVRNATDSELLEMALIENLQREDLNPLEEAAAYRSLMETYRLTQQDLADRLGKKRTTIANVLRLNNLPEPVKQALRENRITMGHARALLSLRDPADMVRLCDRILRQGLSVRSTEKAAASVLRGKGPKKAPPPGDRAYFEELGNELTSLLGARVRIAFRGRSGSIRIDFQSPDELDRLLDWFRGG